MRKRTKTRPATLAEVKAKQARRSSKARAADSAGTAKHTATASNRDAMGRWMKNPRRMDVSGVDTKGKGAAPRKTRTTTSRSGGITPAAWLKQCRAGLARNLAEVNRLERESARARAHGGRLNRLDASHLTGHRQEVKNLRNEIARTLAGKPVVHR